MKAVTANLLATGGVVYLGPDDQWVGGLEDALQFEGPGAQDALEISQMRVLEIAGAYLIEVSEENAAAGRERLRESIRNAGPTVRADLGTQANNKEVCA